MPLASKSFIYYHPLGLPEIHEKILELTCEDDCIRDTGLVPWKFINIRNDRSMIMGKYYGNNYETAFNTFLIDSRNHHKIAIQKVIAIIIIHIKNKITKTYFFKKRSKI